MLYTCTNNSNGPACRSNASISVDWLALNISISFLEICTRHYNILNFIFFLSRYLLSFAVALVGEPPVLLLDEPSTGMGERKEESSFNVGVGVFLFFILYCAFRVGLNYPGSANVR